MWWWSWLLLLPLHWLIGITRKSWLDLDWKCGHVPASIHLLVIQSSSINEAAASYPISFIRECIADYEVSLLVEDWWGMGNIGGRILLKRNSVDGFLMVFWWCRRLVPEVPEDFHFNINLLSIMICLLGKLLIISLIEYCFEFGWHNTHWKKIRNSQNSSVNSEHK